MNYIVSTNNSLTFNESEKVKSVLQNIRMILGTARGSIPLYREFGLDMSFVDKPINVGKTLLIGAVMDAITRFETRAAVNDIRIEIDEKAVGRLIPIVEVEIL
ncbi:MAG: GPW/gp25 family protein [Oscillospiraceae bacterium]|jgi:phage baseplate assembly protein W|nr:GPW/gp25 family protein [Oscillospiraceae bacterium]